LKEIFTQIKCDKDNSIVNEYILAVIILHNICIDSGDPIQDIIDVEEQGEDDDDDSNNVMDEEERLVVGEARREKVKRRLFLSLGIDPDQFEDDDL